MKLKNDLTNKYFENLLVLGYFGRDKFRQSIYLCKCLCGNITKVGYSSLISGNTKSCGCLGAMVKSTKSLILVHDILPGEKFGNLTIIKQDFRHLGTKPIRKRARFLCRCTCGKEKVFVGNDLLNGKTKGCGCGKVNHLKRMNENRKNKYKKKKKCPQCGKIFKITHGTQKFCNNECYKNKCNLNERIKRFNAKDCRDPHS